MRVFVQSIPNHLYLEPINRRADAHGGAHPAKPRGAGLAAVCPGRCCGQKLVTTPRPLVLPGREKTIYSSSLKVSEQETSGSERDAGAGGAHRQGPLQKRSGTALGSNV